MRIELEKSIFCFHLDMYRAEEKRLIPLIAACERISTEHKNDSFILVECRDWNHSTLIRRSLQRFDAEERRKARIKNATGHHLKEHYRTLWDIQSGRCYFSGELLGETFEDRNFSIDHLVPLATRSFPYADIPGTNWPINLALVTLRVNKMKGGKRPDEFIDEVRRKKPFIPRPTKERREIDSLRGKVFGDYMRYHCSKFESDWY